MARFPDSKWKIIQCYISNIPIPSCSDEGERYLRSITFVNVYLCTLPLIVLRAHTEPLPSQISLNLKNIIGYLSVNAKVTTMGHANIWNIYKQKAKKKKFVVCVIDLTNFPSTVFSLQFSIYGPISLSRYLYF